MNMKKNPVVHFEFGCEDGNEVRSFLKGLFDWNISGEEDGFQIAGENGAGIGGHIAELAPEWGHYVTVYVQVEDIDSYCARALDLGGKVLVPPVDLPGKGRFAWLGSPEGHIIGILEPQ